MGLLREEKHDNRRFDTVHELMEGQKLISDHFRRVYRRATKTERSSRLVTRRLANAHQHLSRPNSVSIHCGVIDIFTLIPCGSGLDGPVNIWLLYAIRCKCIMWTQYLAGMESSRQLPRLEAASRQFFNWLGFASASHGLASVSTLLPRPRLCLIVSASVLARSGI